VFRRIEDFVRIWNSERDATLKVFAALTEPALVQPVAPGGRTLGRLAWHIVLTVPEMMGHAGLAVAGPAEDAPQPARAEMVSAYTESSARLVEAVRASWTDAMLEESIPMYGEQWRRGDVLTALVAHQTHHRGQMTVLMRQAGLTVPGIYGPAREEWASMGMSAPA
jgi:uncharacterized damage-inducible protein DinB